MLVRPFSCYTLIKSHEEKDGEWFFHAPPALMDQKDADGHTLVKAGVMNGLGYWRKNFGGMYDYQHKYKRTGDLDLIVANDHGDAVVDGVPNVVGRLLKSKPDAQKIWRHLGDGGRIGLSIDGLAVKTDPRDRNRVLDTQIHLITIDPFPKGFDGVRLKPGLPPDFVQLHKSLSHDLASGDVADWYDVDSLELDGDDFENPDPRPFGGYISPDAFMKALTIGDMPAGPGTTGYAANREEYVVGDKSKSRKPSAQTKPSAQVRCTSCGKKNSVSNLARRGGKCRECGKSVKAKA